MGHCNWAYQGLQRESGHNGTMPERMVKNEMGGNDNTPCPLGRYGRHDESEPTFDTLETACPELCPAGSYGLKVGQYLKELACSALNACNKGCYCPQGSSKPCSRACPPGKYGDETGLKRFKDCKVCDPGFICTGKDNKTPCQPGKFGNVRNASSAKIGCSGMCPLGKYGLEEGHQFEYSACKFCAAGWYPKSGAQPGAAKLNDACDKCKAGTYKEYVGNDPCTLCPLGYYGDIGDAKKNITPSIGKTNISEACVNRCPPGTHGKSLGQYNSELGCVLCEEGKYTEAYNQKVCKSCSSGKYSKEVVGGKSEKEACSASCQIGYYCPSNGQKFGCPPGRFGFAEDKIRCPYQCPPGKYGVGVGRQFEYSACALCQAGKYGVIEAPTWKCKDMPIQYSIKACYSVENFDSSTSKWHAFTSQNSGEQFTGIGKASRTEIIRKKIDSYSKSRHITYVQGSVETGIDFGDIIKSETYTVCSVQRYTGSTMEKILQGTGNGEWWHGHYKGYTGSFKYGGNFDRAIPGKRKGTPSSTTEYTRHNWIASCATNVVNSTYFVNGNEYYASGGKAVTKGIAINPENRDQKSDWGVAFLATWDYELSREQLKKISKWLNPNISSPLFLDYPRIPCLPCAAGKYNNEVGKLTCQNCMSGRYGANDKCENGLRAIQKKDKGVSYDVNCDYPGDSVAKSIGISSIPCDKLPGVENCLSTKEAIDKNTCQHFGMDIIVPRSEAHWKKLLERYDESYFSVVPGIYKETDGQPVEVPMNSDAMTATGKHGYRALDGGKWWLRDDVVSQPDKNYTKFAWLKILNITDTRP
eukprot:g6184.t1